MATPRPRVPSVRLLDYRCRARRGDRPFEERHERSCIAFVWSGSFTYRVGTTATTLGPGALMLGNAGDAYECSHEHVGGDRCLSVLYDEGSLAEVAGAVHGRGASHRFRVPALPPFGRAGGFAYALAAAHRGASAWSVEEIALELAAWVVGAATGARGPRTFGRRDASRVVDAMLYLDEHSGEALTLGDLAARAGASPFQFLRTFRAVLGVTPHQYLVRRRLVTAAALLLDTDAPITSIAYDVGFGDLAHFIRSFGRAFGCAPRAFRRAGGLPAASARSAKYSCA